MHEGSRVINPLLSPSPHPPPTPGACGDVRGGGAHKPLHQVRPWAHQPPPLSHRVGDNAAGVVGWVVHMCACVRACVCACVRACVRAYMRVCDWSCMCACVCVCICVLAGVCFFHAILLSLDHCADDAAGQSHPLGPAPGEHPGPPHAACKPDGGALWGFGGREAQQICEWWCVGEAMHAVNHRTITLPVPCTTSSASVPVLSVS